ncbi:MAG: DASS family sodium-coupled anion symporter [Pyrinomonadaceae bacterium]
MKRWIFLALAAALLIVVPQLLIESATYARIVSIVGVCLLLWISEAVPPFVPTLLLWTLVPLFLAPLDGKFALPNVLSWAVDPVMALFFGGFVLGVATESNGLDKRLTRFALRSAGKSFRRFLLFVILITALLSMWMSNIAAAALVLACLHPILGKFENDHILRRSLLIGVALGADFGGIATPIGTGPNAIAIASISATQPVSFLSWMAFAFPLTVGMLLASFLFLSWRVRRNENDWKARNNELNASVVVNEERPDKQSGQIGFLIILVGTIVLWLTEPLHKMPAAVVALGSAAALFLSGILSKKDLLRIDWSTLLLIAGGITLGRLLEQSALVRTVAANVPFADLDPTFSLFLLCLASAILSSLMSNTATVVMLIPLANALIPSPSTAILIAVSASFGMPFIVSTPPNAMVFGEGGVKFGDLFRPGIVLMLVGCLLVSLTGRAVLNFAGIS